MNVESLITTHGYLIVAIGCLVEGETVVLLAGFAAKRGYLDPGVVFIVASSCAFGGNQLFYWLGRRHGDAVIHRWPGIASHAVWLRDLIERHPSSATIIVRFAYGVRTAGPFLIGMTSMPPVRFAVLNGLSATIWTVLILGAGWLLGAAAETIMGDLRAVEEWVLAGLVVAVVAWRVIERRRARAAA